MLTTFLVVCFRGNFNHEHLCMCANISNAEQSVQILSSGENSALISLLLTQLVVMQP